MQYSYTTDRLIIKTLNESYAPAVLSFYFDNRAIFEPWEPRHSDNYYTYNYQRALLTAENNLFRQRGSARFFVFLKEAPSVIIGTINFYQVLHSPENSCKLGYKFAAAYQHHGYAYEAISAIIPIIMKEFQLSRIEANIMPINAPSLALIERLGFTYEGIAFNCCEIMGEQKTHLRYSILCDGTVADPVPGKKKGYDWGRSMN